MSNMETYVNTFVECFEITKEEARTLTYQAVNAWDSVGHMDLIATLEDAFDIMMETDDIIDFNSFEKGIELLKKYGVDMEM
ncbi:acyl carrier protein [Candidatus Merdisoma sp. JLR.KK011]|jgi:acyl carrier protein|uniref:acyl carrier protein n=1 Tax=Candidatus Merdisoma sp. JLR.KK011 TaxID=3114299 RepID=UPI002FEFE45D